MPQLNLNMTPRFEASLKRFMKLRGLRSKSEAIRLAVEESLERSLKSTPTTDFSTWLGIASGAGEDANPRFRTDDELWS